MKNLTVRQIQDIILLKKYPNLSMSDIEAARLHEDKMLGLLKSDIEEFKKEFSRFWKRDIDDKDIAKHKKKWHKGAFCEAFCAARDGFYSVVGRH